MAPMTISFFTQTRSLLILQLDVFNKYGATSINQGCPGESWTCVYHIYVGIYV